MIAAQPGCERATGRQTVVRWLKFNFVGALGVLVQLALLWLLASVLKVHVLAATALAVEGAVLHNFAWHERVTWSDRGRPSRRERLRRLLRFHLGNGAVSLLSNVALMAILTGPLRLPVLRANVLAIAITSVANYVLADRFVFVRQAP